MSGTRRVIVVRRQPSHETRVVAGTTGAVAGTEQADRYYRSDRSGVVDSHQ